MNDTPANRLKIWVEAARPRTWATSVSPVLIATAMAWAHGKAHWGMAATCFFFALLAQIASNFGNDYFDYRKGSDKADRVGPRRAVAAGDISPRAMLAATVVTLGIACLLCLMGSVSATLIICFVSFIILICSKIPKKFVLWTIPIVIGAVSLVFVIHTFTGVFSRIDTFTARVERHFSDDEEEMSAAELQELEDKQFQERQAREAIQLGGILGRGPGNSIKRDILPNAYDDYIYSIIVEEYGLIGGAFVIFLYLWFFYRCLRIAASCRKDFSLITVLGLSTLITLQAFLHIFVNTGIIPVTGQTLPMISRGGSSLIIMSSAFGIILSVNRTIVIKDMKLKAQKEAQSCSTES